MLSPKQARRQLAKSRRRVWRLANQIGALWPRAPRCSTDNDLTEYVAAASIPYELMVRHSRRSDTEAGRVAAEYLRRLAAWRVMEAANAD